MDIIYTTLKQIRRNSPCEDGYKKLVKSLGGVGKYGKDTPLTFKQIYESNGYDDTLWCMRAVDEKWYPLWRHFACDCADDVCHLMTDERSKNAIHVARKHADGLATHEELAAAGDAAWAAALAAARAAAGDAAGDAARAAAWAAAGAAAGDAALAAALAAARAAAGDAAGAAAGDAAWAAAWDAQMKRLFKYCETGTREQSCPKS
jgi:hypothetical protein